MFFSIGSEDRQTLQVLIIAQKKDLQSWIRFEMGFRDGSYGIFTEVQESKLVQIGESMLVDFVDPVGFQGQLVD